MPQCASPDDRDGDGTCDSLDVCPDIPDPGQADLDGDHIGWMCDPVESITLPTLGFSGYVQAAIHADTFAARTKIDCPSGSSPPCGHVVLQVSAAGMVVARWDSTAPIDAWQAVAWMDGPLVTADDRVLWSRGHEVGDTGDYDLATRVFTSRASGVFDPDDLKVHEAAFAGSRLLAVGLSMANDGLTHSLVDVRADGTLPTVATAQGFTGLAGSAESIGIAGAPARALVPVRAQFHDGLALYTQGAATLAPILANGSPLDNLADLEGVPVDGRRIALCAQRGSDVFAVGTDASGQLAVHQLPIADCLAVTAADRGGVRLFFKDLSLVGYTFAGAFHALATLGPPQIIGQRPPLLVNASDKVLLIADDGSSSLVSSGFDSAVAAMSGTTIHVFAHIPDPTDPSGINGDWVLERHRVGQPVETVTLLTDIENSIGQELITTVEGAAIVNTLLSPTVIVPSGSMMPVPSPVGTLTGGIRDGRTVLFSSDTLGAGTVYLYRESSGTPQLAELDAIGANNEGTLIDSEQATSYFMYSNDTAGCRIARLTAADALETIACAQPAALQILGTRADGAVVITDAASTFTLAQDGAHLVSPRRGDQPILDGAVLVGWTGNLDAQQQFSCLAMHPERCWAYPFGTTTQTFADAAADRFEHILATAVAQGQIKLVIVRSIGPGTL